MSETITVTGASSNPWRSFRARLLVNGSERAETLVESFVLQRTRYSRADTLSLSLAIDRAALAQQSSKWWDVTAASGTTPPDINVTLQMCNEENAGAQWATMFSGIVDRVRWHPVGTRLDLECRDMLAKLLDLRVQEAWMNRTASEVVKAVIAAAGLTADVSLAEDRMNGQFWQIEHKRTTSSSHHRFQTAYDVARFIANEYGCDLYAEGSTIVCAPVGQPTDSAATVHTLTYTDSGPDSPIVSDAITLELERDYITSRNVVVHVMSWDSRQRTTAETYFSAQGHSRTLAEDAGTLYSFRFPGLRKDALDQRAEALYRDIVAHNRTVTLTMPGRIDREPRDFMTLSGTGSSWDVTADTAYTIDAVTTSFSAEGAFMQDITLRNRVVSQGSNNDAD